MKKQPEVTAKTKKAFMDAFSELYSEKPIEKISVQEITDKAGYNRSSFYQHFRDVYDLLDYLEKDVLDFMHQRLQMGKGSVQEIITVFDEKGFYLNALFGDYGGNRFLEKLKANVPFQSHNLNISKDNPISPYLMEFHLSTILSLLRFWHRRERDIPPEEILNLIFRLYMGGIKAINDQE
jgi:AcrR family transcriptional regulator